MKDINIQETIVSEVIAKRGLKISENPIFFIWMKNLSPALFKETS